MIQNAFKIKNGLIVDGNSEVNGYIQFNTGYTATAQTGRVYYDTTENALSYFPTTPNMDVTLNIGQESFIRVYNGSGAQINNGQVVHISGSTNGLPGIVLANASKLDRSEVSGVATHNIPNGSDGFITNFGVVKDINLSAFRPGDEVYLSDVVDGGITDSGARSIAFTSRVNALGWVITSGATGKLLVRITNEDSTQSLTSKERNILIGNTSSTGVFSFTGMTLTVPVTGTTFNISPVKAWLVDNTSNPTIPTVQLVQYTGGTGLTSPYLNTNTTSYVLLTSAATITVLNTFPTPQQRRQNIYLGKLGHPNKSTFNNVFNEPDYDMSPLSQLRDVFTPIRLINGGVIPTAVGGNLSFKNTSGTLYGLGINYINDILNPNTLAVSANNPTTFQYRTQTGGTATNVTLIDPTLYDVGGTTTAVGGGTNSSTNQRIYILQNGQIRVQYGQVVYGSLSAAIAAIPTESFIVFPNWTNNAVLIGVLSVTRSATDLSISTQANFTLPSKFGDVNAASGGGGSSTTTLQQAYDNSTQPEILTNSTLGAVTFKRGSTADTDRVIEVQNNAGVNTFGVTGLGDISGNSLNLKTYLYDSTNTTGTTNQVLFTSPSGVRWNNIDSIVTGYTSSKLNITDFSSYSSNTNTLIGTKLNITDFSSYSSNTNTLIGTKLNITDFSSYSSNTNTLIGTKLNITDFSSYSSNTNTLIGTKLNITDFSSYSSNTLTSINNKVIEAGSGVLSTVRINANNITSGNYSGVLSGTGNTASGIYSTILGGKLNIVTGSTSSIGGGQGNTITSIYSKIGAGCSNTVLSDWSIIGGGTTNTASAIFTTIGGGSGNTISTIFSTAAGGVLNTASGNYASIGGGCKNVVGGLYGTVAGGRNNSAGGESAIVLGGQQNAAIFTGGAIAGGCLNTSNCFYVTIAGGCCNSSNGDSATIIGGKCNRSSGNCSTISGGYGNTVSAAHSSVGGGCKNTVSGACSGLLGGSGNTVSNCFSLLIGGCRNSVSGTYNAIPAVANTLVGGINNTIVTSFSGVTGINYVGYSYIGGGFCNTNYGTFSTISGGINNTSCSVSTTVGGGCGNTSSARYSTVVGGHGNTASGNCAVAGGRLNVPSATGAVAFGTFNTASGTYSVVAGGRSTTASGYASAIAGGRSNTAVGACSFVGGGFRAISNGACSVVGGGCNNTSFGIYSAILGGLSGYTNSYSVVVGGKSNTASGTYSGILGSTGNTLTGNHSFAIGTDISGVTNYTTFVRSLNVSPAQCTIGNQETGILVKGSGTVGGASYLDIIRGENTSPGTTNGIKTIRIGGVGTFEVVNSAYSSIILSLTDAGVLSTPGGGTSDLRTKTNIEYIGDPYTPFIQKLKPVRFEFNDKIGVKRHGFIAQDVLEIKPDLVLGDGDKENGTYGLDYDGILALTVKALQEANIKIDNLEREISDIKALLNK